MLSSFLIVLPVFGLIAIGYGARWLRLLRETTGEGLSDFVFVLAVRDPRGRQAAVRAAAL